MSSTRAPVTPMSVIARCWVAFAALGTGLIHLALVIGAPAPLAVTFGVLGFVEFAWGVVTFAREPFGPRVAVAVAIAPIVALGVLVAVAGSGVGGELVASITLLPLAVAGLFEVFVVAALGLHLRREGERSARDPGAARTIIGVAAGALVIVALTATALAAAQAESSGTSVDVPLDPGPEHGQDPEH